MKQYRSKFITAAALITLIIALSLLASNFFTPNNQPFGYVSSPTGTGVSLASGNETLMHPSSRTVPSVAT